MDRRRFARTLALGAAGSLVLPAWAKGGGTIARTTVRLPGEVLHVRHGALDVPVGDRSSGAWWSTLRRDVFLADGLTRDPSHDAHLIALTANGPRLFMQGDEVELWEEEGARRSTVQEFQFQEVGPFRMGIVHRSGSIGPAAHARLLVPVRGVVLVDGSTFQEREGLVLSPGSTAQVNVASEGVLLAISRSG